MSAVACLGKRQYVDEGDAWDVLARKRDRGEDTERLEPYRCAHCEFWHLGQREIPSALLALYKPRRAAV